MFQINFHQCIFHICCHRAVKKKRKKRSSSTVITLSSGIHRYKVCPCKAFIYFSIINWSYMSTFSNELTFSFVIPFIITVTQTEYFQDSSEQKITSISSWKLVMYRFLFRLQSSKFKLWEICPELLRFVKEWCERPLLFERDFWAKRCCENFCKNILMGLKIWVWWIFCFVALMRLPTSFNGNFSQFPAIQKKGQDK